MVWEKRKMTRHLLPVLFALCILGVICAAAPFCTSGQVHAAWEKTSITGVLIFRDPISTDRVLYDNITVKPAYGRTVKLYYFDVAKDKWVCKATYKLKKTATSNLKVTFTDEWKKAVSTKWRIKVLKAHSNADAGTPAMKTGRIDITIHNRSVDKFAKTTITGAVTTFDQDYTANLADKVTVCPAYGRTVTLYVYNENTKKWKRKAAYPTANKYSDTITIKYPQNWKAHYESKWRIVARKTEPDKTKNLPALPKGRVTVTVYNKVGNMGSGIVMDQKGNVLYEHDMHKKMSPASMSKMMTAILMEEKLDHGDRVTIKQAAKDEIRSLWGPYYDGYSTGEYMKEYKALYAMLLPSSNVVAISSGIRISGSTAKFGKLMTQKAKDIGCLHTTYKNASGLEGDGTNNGKGNWSTAYDQALIGRYIMTNKDMSYIRTVVKTGSRQIKTSHRTFWVGNTNPVLGEFGNVGIKTGTEIVAGNCFCGAFNYNKQIYITVVMQASSKRYDTIDLFDYMKYAVKNKITLY